MYVSNSETIPFLICNAKKTKRSNPVWYDSSCSCNVIHSLGTLGLEGTNIYSRIMKVGVLNGAFLAT